MDGAMPAQNEAVEGVVKSKRPSDSAFKQQRLPAWQPVLTAGTVLPTFFVIGIAFIPIGIGLLHFSDEVNEHIIDYTHCIKQYETNVTCADFIQYNPQQKCECVIDFTLNQDFTGNVFIYYGLSNYYQNHRRYVKSRDDEQLLGILNPTPASECIPFDKIDGVTESKPIAPCGAIANSLFNDTLSISSKVHGPVKLLRTEIAWPSDKQIKFRNPPGNLQEALKDFAKPVAWSRPLYELDLENEDNNGFQNEDLIVWMRTAALPTFRKLYRRVDHNQKYFDHGLYQGNYTLHVDYAYPVTAFEGTKKMIISTTSLLGGKNPFLGIAYIVVGCICLLLGVVLLIIHIRYSKSTTELINVSPSTPYS